jgi:hypothetical protein
MKKGLTIGLTSAACIILGGAIVFGASRFTPSLKAAAGGSNVTASFDYSNQYGTAVTLTDTPSDPVMSFKSSNGGYLNVSTLHKAIVPETGYGFALRCGISGTDPAKIDFTVPSTTHITGVSITYKISLSKTALTGMVTHSILFGGKDAPNQTAIDMTGNTTFDSDISKTWSYSSGDYYSHWYLYTYIAAGVTIPSDYVANFEIKTLTFTYTCA